MALEDRIRLPALSLIHRRPRLLNLLEEFIASQNRLITIYAPGGYGKSILLADFAQTTNLPVCWCSVEPADRDPTSFLTLLAYSITDRFHEIERDGLLRLVERGDTQTSIRRIVELLSGVGAHIIIIDDYHKAVSAGMTLVLNKLLERLPENSTVIVAARGDMNLATGQVIELLMTGRVTGLSEEELRFTPEELQRVIRKRFGRQIDLLRAIEIARATDGNIAQILLAGHTMHVDPLIARLGRLGDDREMIYDYLAGEVFGKQSPELQQFMLYTSVLPELTSDLCNELLEVSDTQVYIKTLLDHDLFITRVGTGFRYHDLFAEFLRHKLAENTDLYHQISVRAARLLAARSRFEDAINLYLSVQSWDNAAAILEMKGRFFYDTGRALTLHNWLSQFTLPKLDRHPRLLLLEGQILNNDLGEPKQAIAFYEQAEEKFLQQGDLTGAAETQVLRGSALRMMGRAREGLVLTAGGLERLEALQADGYLIAWARRYRGMAHFTVGNSDEALADLRLALSMFERLKDTYLTGMCHHDIGVCLEKQGNIDGAEHHYEQALRIWESLGNANDLANTLNSLGVCAYWRRDYAEAQARFKQSLDIAGQIGATRRIAFAQAGIGDTYLACQDWSRALEAYATSTEFAQEAGVHSLEIYNMVKTGECFYQQGQLDQALKLANQARYMAAETGLVLEEGIACALQAKIYVRRGEYEASFELLATATGCLSSGDVLEQASVRLWWGYSLLLNQCAAAALDQLQEAIRLVLAMGELRPGLELVVTETQRLLLHFLYREDTPASLRNNIYLLLTQNSQNVSAVQPGLQVFAFGAPTLIVGGMRRQFNQRGGTRRIPEFLLYLILEGQSGGCRWSDVCAAIWPDLEPHQASTMFHQYLRRFRNVIFDSSNYIVLQDDYYQVAERYLDWCDALAFDTLFERAARATPAKALGLYMEIISLYQGEFLAGFELGDWGNTYRASCESRFLQVVRLAGEQLLKDGLPREALAVIQKGLARDNFQEDLHRTAFKAYAQAGLHAQLTAHYTNLCVVFEEELAASPSSETTRLYRSLIDSH